LCSMETIRFCDEIFFIHFFVIVIHKRCKVLLIKQFDPFIDVNLNE
jgi:hypothetical protein